NKIDVQNRLKNLVQLNTEIETRKRNIENIEGEITTINGSMDLLRSQLKTLEEQLQERKDKYIKSMKYVARHRGVQDQLMFIFSAESLPQMYRRLRFVREYAAYQRAQGEMVKEKQQQLTDKHKELEKQKTNKNTLLYKGKQEHAALEGQQQEQQKVVASLQQQQKTIQSVLAEQRQKDAQLNAQIDRLVAEEIAKAKARAEAEARKRAAAEAAAKKKRAEELARKKAAAEAAARENARRIAEARAAEERAKAEQRAAAKKSAEEKARAERAAKAAEERRLAAERKARADEERSAKEVDRVTRENEAAETMATVDRQLSSNFESNRGRLPMSMSGRCRIVSHFGQYNVEGLRNVTLDNTGINIQGQPGAAVRSVFNGEVSAVFSFSGTNVVMVRHGRYISVYCNLKSVSVHRGQQVKTGQTLGTVGTDNILQFQLRKETAKLNPESWLGR
ncbi:MAG: peptidoglycan DD-metalloendopeptidase family protein, partial [Prevotella sp.]|nr:peptidoglycan DD-metalloendopeptidase family protein [Prevotella sp.]